MLRTLAALALRGHASRRPHPDDRGRPVILLLHGRGLLDRDTTAMRRLWLESLTQGARGIGRDVPLDARDVRLVWYADVLDPRSSAGCDYASTDPRARASVRSPTPTSAPSCRSWAVCSVRSQVSSLTARLESQLRGLAADASFLDRYAQALRVRAAACRRHRAGSRRRAAGHSGGAQPGIDRRLRLPLVSQRQRGRSSSDHARVRRSAPRICDSFFLVEIRPIRCRCRKASLAGQIFETTGTRLRPR